MNAHGGAGAPHEDEPFPLLPWRAAPGPPGQLHEWRQWTGVRGMFYASKVLDMSRVTVRGRTLKALQEAMDAVDEAWMFRRAA